MPSIEKRRFTSPDRRTFSNPDTTHPFSHRNFKVIVAYIIHIYRSRMNRSPWARFPLRNASRLQNLRCGFVRKSIVDFSSQSKNFLSKFLAGSAVVFRVLFALTFLRFWIMFKCLILLVRFEKIIYVLDRAKSVLAQCQRCMNWNLLRPNGNAVCTGTDLRNGTVVSWKVIFPDNRRSDLNTTTFYETYHALYTDYVFPSFFINSMKKIRIALILTYLDSSFIGFD